MNIEALRRTTITLSKADLVRLLKQAHPDDMSVQSLPDGSKRMPSGATMTVVAEDGVVTLQAYTPGRDVTPAEPLRLVGPPRG